MLVATAAPVAAATVAHWNFNEGAGIVAHDGSPNGHDAIVCCSPWTSGPTGSAIEVDGQCGGANAFSHSDFSGTDRFTVEALIRIDAFPAQGAYGVIAAVWDHFRGFREGTQQAFRLAIHGRTTGPVLLFEVRTDRETWYDGIGVAADITTTGEWVHVAGVFDNGTLELYLDGALVGKLEMYPSAHIKSADSPVTIGHCLGTNNAHDDVGTTFAGAIAEVRCSRDALDPSQFLQAAPATVGHTRPRRDTTTLQRVESELDASPVTAPAGITLRAAPNPFEGSTRISFDVPEGEGHVHVGVYDVSGRLVTTLFESSAAPGAREIVWAGSDSRGRRLAAGVYFVQLETDAGRQVRKIVMLR